MIFILLISRPQDNVFEFEPIYFDIPDYICLRHILIASLKYSFFLDFLIKLITFFVVIHDIESDFVRMSFSCNYLRYKVIFIKILEVTWKILGLKFKWIFVLWILKHSLSSILCSIWPYFNIRNTQNLCNFWFGSNHMNDNISKSLFFNRIYWNQTIFNKCPPQGTRKSSLVSWAFRLKKLKHHH